MIQNRAGLSTRIAALVFFIGLYLIGLGYFLSAAETTTINPMLFWNRVHLYLLVGGILIGIYIWVNFKPKRLSTRQYTYHPWGHEDIPDSMRGNPSWGSGRYVNKGTLKEGEEPTEPSKEFWMKKREEYKRLNPEKRPDWRKYKIGGKDLGLILVFGLIFILFIGYFPVTSPIQQFIMIIGFVFLVIPMLWLLTRGKEVIDLSKIYPYSDEQRWLYDEEDEES